jgi:hypothetical protein
MRASPLQSSFLGGEISPFCIGRVEAERYRISLDTCLNYIPLLQGGIVRRPGTYFVAEAKYSSKTAILQRFEFSTTQAYMIEIGDQYMRFYKDEGQIVEAGKNVTAITQASPCVVTAVGHGYTTGQEVYLTGISGMTQLNGRNFKITVLTADTFSLQYRNGNNVNSTAYGAYTSGGVSERVYEIATTYTEADVEDMAFVQSADVLYITHPGFAPRKLTRTGHTAWTLTTISFIDGPYLPIDKSGITLTPSNATSLTPNITASSALFAASDVGRHIRLSPDGGTHWEWMKITAFTSSTVVTVLRATTTGIGTLALSTWRFGAWSSTTGFPSVAAFHEGRLCYGGAPGTPQRFDMSYSDDYDNFAPSDTAGVVTDAHAVSRTLDSEDVNNIFWMKSEEHALLCGTAAGEWAVRPSVLSEPIAPSNINAKQVTNFGSSEIQPVILGKSIMFVQGSARTLREMSYYNYDVEGYKAPDRTVLADHISGAQGFKQLARQKQKPSVVWATRNDGVLSGMTYEREDDALIVAWHRHVLGGASDAAGSDCIVNWISVIPAFNTKNGDTAWLLTTRWIGGEQKKYIEFLTKIFEHEDTQRDGYHVDCGLTYDAPVAISAITNANPAVVTATAHGFANGDVVYISDVKGMAALNGMTFTVRNKTANTFQIEDMHGVIVDSSNTATYKPYVSSGQVRKYITTISGIWHLEGETVDVWADGAIQPTKVVTNGAITLQNRATTVHIGYAYKSRGKMLRLDAGAADGTSIGKTRRTNRVAFLLHRTLGFKVGPDFDNMQEISFRTNNDPDGRPPSLFTGIKSVEHGADYDFENQICWEQSRPSPGMVLAVAPQLETQDR